MIHLSHLVELETIALGIHGRRSMWEVLAHVVGDDPRLADIDVDELVARADRQQDEVQQHRRAVAQVALARRRGRAPARWCRGPLESAPE